MGIIKHLYLCSGAFPQKRGRLAGSSFHIKGPLVPWRHFCNYSQHGSWGGRQARGQGRGLRWKRRVGVGPWGITWHTLTLLSATVSQDRRRKRRCAEMCTLTDVTLCLHLKSGSWAAKCHRESKAENHCRITGSPGNVQPPQRPPTFHTLARTPAGKTFPQKKSAGRRWSGTINFTLVLPASKPCWSKLRISWHSDTPRGL